MIEASSQVAEPAPAISVAHYGFITCGHVVDDAVAHALPDNVTKLVVARSKKKDEKGEMDNVDCAVVRTDANGPFVNMFNVDAGIRHIERMICDSRCSAAG